jgi:hypothetical protein
MRFAVIVRALSAAWRAMRSLRKTRVHFLGGQLRDDLLRVHCLGPRFREGFGFTRRQAGGELRADSLRVCAGRPAEPAGPVRPECVGVLHVGLLRYGRKSLPCLEYSIGRVEMQYPRPQIGVSV